MKILEIEKWRFITLQDNETGDIYIIHIWDYNASDPLILELISQLPSLLKKGVDLYNIPIGGDKKTFQFKEIDLNEIDSVDPLFEHIFFLKKENRTKKPFIGFRITNK